MEKMLEFWMYDIIHKALTKQLLYSLEKYNNPKEYMKDFGENKWSRSGSINLTIKRIEEIKSEHDRLAKIALGITPTP